MWDYEEKVRSLEEGENFDPNELLEAIRTLNRTYPANAWRGQICAQMFSILDKYLSNGGMPPSDWDWYPLWTQAGS